MKIDGLLDPVTAQLLEGLLSTLGQPRLADPSVPFESRTVEQRQGDSLVEVVELAARCDDLPVQGGDTTTLLLTIDVKQLMENSAEPVMLGESFVSLETAKRLCCSNVGINPIVFHGEAELKLGRTARTANRGQRRALAFRDRGCSFPGCTRRPKWTQPHHVRHWADGGETELGNQTLLCSVHHRLIHHSDWEVVMLDGVPAYIPPKWLDPEQKPIRNNAHQAVG